MEKFRNLQKLIIKFQKDLKLWALVSIIINLVVIVVASLINFTNLNNQKFTAFEACYHGMNSIVNNSPDSELLNDSIVSDLGEKKLSFDYIGLIKLINNYECDVFVKSKDHTRRFFVLLEKSINNPHFYKILDIKEKKITKEYQVL